MNKYIPINRQKISHNITKIKSKFVNMQDRRKFWVWKKVTQKYFIFMLFGWIFIWIGIYFFGYANETAINNNKNTNSWDFHIDNSYQIWINTSKQFDVLKSWKSFISWNILDFFCLKKSNTYTECGIYENIRLITDQKIKQYISQSNTNKLKKTIIEINKIKSKNKENEKKFFILSYIQNQIANHIYKDHKQQIIISKSDSYYNWSYYQDWYYQSTWFSKIQKNKIQKIETFTIQNNRNEKKQLENITLEFQNNTWFVLPKELLWIFMTVDNDLIEWEISWNFAIFKKKIQIWPKNSQNINIFWKILSNTSGYRIWLNCVDSSINEIETVCIKNFQYKNIE